jgi:hypothetical protein
MDEHQVYICIDQKREESKSLERQSNMLNSISAKFRKTVQGNRVGVFTNVLLWLTTSHDENA